MINKLKLLWHKFWLSDVEEGIAELKHFLDYAENNNSNFNETHRAKSELAKLRTKRLSIIAKIARLEN